MRSTARYSRFNGHPFTGTAPACYCGGKGVCVVCEASNAVRIDDLKRVAGEEDTVGNFFSDETLDRSYTSTPSSSLPYIRMVGKLLGMKELENASPDDRPSPVIVRVTNLGGMLSSAIRRLPADKREAALEEIGGMGWTQDVLRTASGLNGKLPASDAVHFSLTLYFLIGYFDAKRGKATVASAAYIRAFGFAEKAQQAGRAQSLGITRRTESHGFAGFGVTRTRPGTVLQTPILPPKPTFANLPSPGYIGEMVTNHWFMVSANGRTVLAVTPQGLRVYYKKSGEPIRDINAVRPENDEAAFAGPDYVRLAAFNTPSGMTRLRGLSLTAEGKLIQSFLASNGQVVEWPLLVGRKTLSGLLGSSLLIASPTNLNAAVQGNGLVPPVANARLSVQDDGNVVLYGPDGKVLQSFDTYAALSASTFPAPPDESPDADAINVDNCGWLLGPPVPVLKQMKVDGIKVAFFRVFNRQPNNAEINYYGRMRWCIDRDGMLTRPPAPIGTPNKSTLEGVMETVRAQILAGKAANTTPPADQNNLTPPPSGNPVLDTVMGWLDEASNWTTDILCKGFRSLFPTAIADVLCSIFQFIIRGAAATVGAVVATVTAVIMAVGALVSGFAKNDPKGALLGFFRELTKAIFFSVSTAFIIPFLTDTDPNNRTAVSDAIKKIDLIAQDAAAKDPIYPLTLTMTVISAVTAPSPQTFLQVLTVLIPVISGLVAPIVKKVPQAADFAITEIQKGIDSLMRLCIYVAMGVMAISDTVNAVYTNLKDKMEKDGAFRTMVCNMAGELPPAAPGQPPRQKTALWCAAQIMKRLANALNPKNPQSITAAIGKFKLDNIANAATSLLTIVPALLLALAGGAVESDPSLKKALDNWFVGANAVPGMLSDRDANEARAAIMELLNALPDKEKAAAVDAQQRTLDRDNSAKLVAQTLWERVGRDGISKPDRDAYFKTMRDTWVAAGGTV